MSFTEYLEEYVFQSLPFKKAIFVYSDLLEVIQGQRVPEQGEITRLQTVNNLYMSL